MVSEPCAPNPKTMTKTAMTGSKSTAGSSDSTATSSSEIPPAATTPNNDQNLQLTVHKLNGGQNYIEWSQSIKLALEGRGRLGYITGETNKPAHTDPTIKQWKSENSMVMSWLINSMESSVGKPYLFLPTAKAIWEAVKDTYSDLENSSQIYDLKIRLWHSKQGERTVTVYYNELITMWQELDQCYDDVWESANDYARHKTREEDDRVYVFLAGLNRDLDEVRGRILGSKPVPSIREVFAEVRREEARRKVMLHMPESSNPEPEGSALVTKTAETDGDKRSKPWCEHCKRPWHTKETCWKLHGKPVNANGRKRSGDRRAYASQETQVK